MNPITSHPGKQQQGKTLVFKVLALLTGVVGLQAATQYFAYSFNYQSELGSNYYHAYLPWRIINWWGSWKLIYPKQFETALNAGVIASVVWLLVCLIYKSFATSSSKYNDTMHGSARWADKSDIKKMGLLDNEDGVYVGGWEDSKGILHYLRHNGPEHILTASPTRSGKGVSLILPTLLSWPYSIVANDMKEELFSLTSGWRKKYAKNKILKFEPASDLNDVFFNPLSEVRVNEGKEVGDVQNLASIIVNPDGKAELDHWEKTSQALLVGVILHVIYKSKLEGTPATLPYVDQLLSPTDVGVKSLWLEMVQYPHINGRPHHAVSSAARDMLDRPEEEAGSVLSTAKSFLALYRDPVVAKAISSSSFHIKDLMNYDTPVSLYIVTSPTDKTRLRPLVRILINSIIRVLADKVEYETVNQSQTFVQKIFGFAIKQQIKQKKSHKHRMLLMLDEFPSLGRLGIIEDALAHVASWGIKFYIICQDIKQLRNNKFGYGQEETITSNCHLMNAFPPNNLETAEHLSKLTGETTIIKEAITTSGKRGAFMDGNVSRHYEEIKRPLLTPDECLRLPGAKKEGELITEGGDMLISVSGFPCIYGKQPLYFKDDIFSRRAAIPAPKNSDRLRNTIVINSNELIDFSVSESA
jgi:type IV secretion system protein VirD4